MRKVFNKVEVENFCSAFENKYGYPCEPDFIYYKTFFKKFNLKDIHFVNIVYELSKENEKEEIVKSYFPSKYEEMVSTYGKGNFYVKKFLYSETDNKIHCIIRTNTGDERHLKLKTDNYSDRISRCSEIFEIQSTGLARRMITTGIHNLVIGISGGLDSSIITLYAANYCKDKNL